MSEGGVRGEGDEALRRVDDEAVSCLVTVVTYNISSWGSIVGLTLLLFPPFPWQTSWLAAGGAGEDD